MKQSRMTDGKEKPGRKSNLQSRPTDSAFDNWLNRGLHELFDGVMNEPVPPEILHIVQDDNKK